MCVEKDKNPIWEDVANKNDFVYQGRHLPYNRELKERARVLRKQMTNCERILWYEFLCDIKPNFLRQRPIDRYIVDFYCPEKQLVVEIDGESHYTDEAKIYDARRTFILENYGLIVLRFTNFQILETFERVCEVIKGYIDDPPLIPPC